tara:strand:- start:467 stop:580 length:114 start_codon:yes stop_codon:yes gene_type:complete
VSSQEVVLGKENLVFHCAFLTIISAFIVPPADLPNQG